jgi:hypothetical protein
MVMSGVPPLMVATLRRVRGLHVWNAFVDVLRRTRRNADMLRGAASDVTIGRSAAVCARERAPTSRGRPADSNHHPPPLPLAKGCCEMVVIFSAWPE